MNEPLGEHLPIELLKVVLVVHVFEDVDATVQLVVHFVLRKLLG